MSYLSDAKVCELERRLSLLEDKLAGQKPLTFTAPECNTPCNAGEEVLHMKSFEAGFKAAENYYRLKAICTTCTGAGEHSNLKEKPDEKWITEFRFSEKNGWSPWYRSRNPVLKNEFSTEAAAQEAICAHQDSILMRRVRRID